MLVSVAGLREPGVFSAEEVADLLVCGECCGCAVSRGILAKLSAAPRRFLEDAG